MSLDRSQSWDQPDLGPTVTKSGMKKSLKDTKVYVWFACSLHRPLWLVLYISKIKIYSLWITYSRGSLLIFPCKQTIYENLLVNRNIREMKKERLSKSVSRTHLLTEICIGILVENGYCLQVIKEIAEVPDKNWAEHKLASETLPVPPVAAFSSPEALPTLPPGLQLVLCLLSSLALMRILFGIWKSHSSQLFTSWLNQNDNSKW